MRRSFSLILTLSLILPLIGRGQFYELKEVLSDEFFYNVVVNSNKLYFSSDSGLFEYDTNSGELILFDKKITAPVNSVLDIITKKSINYSKNYNHLLPDTYKSEYVSAASLKETLILISRGKGFVFKESFYGHKSMGSVRAISENYIGTYSGVFFKNEKLDYPYFTDGRIREFENASFICYNGLKIIYKDKRSINLVSPENYEFKVGNATYGFIYDVVEINHPEYLLFSSKGLLEFNIDSLEINYIEEINTPDHSPSTRLYTYLASEGFKAQLTNVIMYDNKKISKYISNEKRVIDLLEFTEEIVSAVIDPVQLNRYFVLEKQNQIHSYTQKIDSSGIFYDKKYISKHQNDPHFLSTFQNYLMISGNKGLDIVELTSSEVLSSVIMEEFNVGASYVKNDTLILGGIEGLYYFTKKDLNNLFDVIENDDRQLTLEDSFVSNTTLLIGIIFILLIVIVVLLFTKLKSKSKNKKELLKEIDLFIDQNLATVSIQILIEHFKISNSELYKIMDDKKPGDYIRIKRMNKVKHLRSIDASPEEISELTGFSLSYLKKI
ncbi:MAG: hypothetical protein VW262_02030 [Flavobacteriaceae bacterium]